MGLNNLENKIRQNLASFDEEPSNDHLDNFRIKLAQMEKPVQTNKNFLFASNKAFALAASISIFIIIGIFALLEFPTLEAKPQLSEELMHVKMYYNQQTDEKIAEIRNCNSQTGTSETRFETAEDRLQKLENNTQQLEQKVSQANGNKQLKSAYIQSLKAKSEAVNQIYTSLCENTNNIITQ